jgi:hypothetical protein
VARRDKSKKEKLDPFERARLKKLRAAQRREERKKRRAEAGDDDGRRSKKEPPRPTKWHDPNDLEWLHLNGVRTAAARIMNDSYRQPAPFWLSVPKNPRPEPTNFYPCRSFERGDRVWYGFLFRAHRDEQLLIWGNKKARKELTELANMR